MKHLGALMRRSIRARVVILLSASIVALGLTAGQALASEYSADVTIGPEGLFTGPVHSYYEIDACPIATFNVPVLAIGYLFNASGIGNASGTIYQCVVANGVEANENFYVYNPSPSNSREFKVHAFY